MNQHLSKLLVASVITLSFGSSALLAKEVKLSVKGMKCSFCAQGIEKGLKDESGVKDVKVDLENNLVTVSLADDAKISKDRFQKIIKDAGYELHHME